MKGNSRIPQMFIDGLGQVSLSRGVVRCELVNVAPNQAEDGKENKNVEVSPQMQMVTTPQGLLQMTSVLNGFINQLEEKGIIKREKKQ